MRRTEPARASAFAAVARAVLTRPGAARRAGLRNVQPAGRPDPSRAPPPPPTPPLAGALRDPPEGSAPEPARRAAPGVARGTGERLPGLPPAWGPALLLLLAVTGAGAGADAATEVATGAALGAGAAAPAAVGLWRTEANAEGHVGQVRIARCGPALCGTLEAVTGPDGRRIAAERIGTRILWGLTAEAPGRYRGGRIFDPGTGRDYDARMEEEGRRLRVSGCVMGFCRGQLWDRID